LGAVDDRHAGVASGVNTTVSRAAQLAAVAVLPVAVGLTGDDFLRPETFSDGFRTAMLITAALAAAGGLVAWATVRNPELVPEREAVAVPGPVYFCGAEGAPLATSPGPSAGDKAA
jgi:L-aminopeptidase/D-esterase-like protein